MKRKIVGVSILSMFTYIYVYVSIYVHISIFTYHVHQRYHIYMYIYIHVFVSEKVCICMCVYVGMSQNRGAPNLCFLVKKRTFGAPLFETFPYGSNIKWIQKPVNSLDCKFQFFCCQKCPWLKNVLGWTGLFFAWARLSPGYVLQLLQHITADAWPPDADHVFE